MIDVNFCPLCGSEEKVIIAQQNFPDKYLTLIDDRLNLIPRSYIRCKDCDLIYRTPKLSDLEQKSLYNKYRDENFRSESPDQYFDRISGYSNEKSENYLKFKWILDGLKGPLTNKSKILDVGCGGGVLLHKIKSMMPSAITFGVEPNLLYSSLARSRSGALNIVTGYFSPNLFEDRFDLIVSSDVLEHVDDPFIFLSEIKSILNDAGWLFIEVPSQKNFGDLPSRHDMFNVAHHVFYSNEILYELFHKLKFTNIIVDSVRYDSGVWKTRVIGRNKSSL